MRRKHLLYETKKLLRVENIYCAEKTIITRRKHLYLNKHVLHKESIMGRKLYRKYLLR